MTLITYIAPQTLIDGLNSGSLLFENQSNVLNTRRGQIKSLQFTVLDSNLQSWLANPSSSGILLETESFVELNDGTKIFLGALSRITSGYISGAPETAAYLDSSLNLNMPVSINSISGNIKKVGFYFSQTGTNNFEIYIETPPPPYDGVDFLSNPDKTVGFYGEYAPTEITWSSLVNLDSFTNPDTQLMQYGVVFTRSTGGGSGSGGSGSGGGTTSDQNLTSSIATSDGKVVGLVSVDPRTTEVTVDGQALPEGSVVRNSVTGQKFLKFGTQKTEFIAIETEPLQEWGWDESVNEYWEDLQNY